MSDPNTSLLWAVIEGNPGHTTAALDAGADVGLCSSTGSSLLHAAALNGKASLISRLLKTSKVRLDQKDDEGFTCLMVAALNGKSNAVTALLDGGADPNQRRNNGETALHLATNSANHTVVATLLLYGANINAETSDKSTPLHYAARLNKLSVAKVLLRHAGCDISAKNSKHHTAAEVATRFGYHALARYLDMATSSHSQQDKALFEAVLNSNVDAARVALNGGANVNMFSLTGSTLLHTVAVKGSMPLLNLLLDTPGCFVDKQDDEGFTPLMVAALNGHSDAIHKLLACRADPCRTRSNGETPLHLATNSTSRGVVNALLDYGADINAETSDSRSTPLHYAAMANNLTVATVLLKNPQCYQDQKDGRNHTASQVALECGHQDMARMLGAAADSVDTITSKPYHHFLPMRPWVVRGHPVQPERDVYKVISYPRGHVFLINYANFGNYSYRRGSQQDVLNVEYVFSKMGYKVFTYQDLDLEATKKEMSKFCHNKELEEVDVVIVCVLSHGEDRNTFFTSDDRKMTVDQVYRNFKTAACPQLKGKPKLFLFNFCRGNKIEAGCSLDENKYDAQSLGTAQQPPDDCVRPNPNKDEGTVEPLEDSYTIFATVEGVQALRHERDGTCFIQALTEVLAQHAHKEHVADLATRLSNHMKNRLATMPDRQDWLRKKFYLNPCSGH